MNCVKFIIYYADNVNAFAVEGTENSIDKHSAAIYNVIGVKPPDIIV